MYTVYILKCADKTYYKGCSGNFTQRLNAHKKGKVNFTKARLPIEVVLTLNFNCKKKAFLFEKYLKSGSGRAFAKRHFY